MALHGLGAKPRFDPLPVFDEIMTKDYESLPPYTTSFFPLAYATQGKAFPKDYDRKIRALMVQDEDGYLHNHIANTFHLAHYYALMGEPTPKADAMLKRVLRDQKTDGSWLLNPPARDRHATFDAVFTLMHLGKDRPECRQAARRAGDWALRCRNADGGFGHYPRQPVRRRRGLLPRRHAGDGRHARTCEGVARQRPSPGLGALACRARPAVAFGSPLNDGQGLIMHNDGRAPARAWVVTFAGTAVNLCLGILYAWSVWKANLVADPDQPARHRR